LRWPGVVAESETTEDQWQLASIEASQEALKQLLRARQEEGKALALVLGNILTSMEAIVTRIEPKMPEMCTNTKVS